MDQLVKNDNANILITPNQVRQQIKKLLAMSGGVFISEKAFKAVYAILQSIAPNDFPLEWDALFFSIYSRIFHDELSCLVLETGEVQEAIWRGGVEPLHHIYFLKDGERRTSEKAAFEAYCKKPYWIDFLFWSVLPPKFPVFWSYLLEMSSYEKLDGETKKELPYLPLLKDEEDETKKDEEDETKMELQELLNELSEQLDNFSINPLKVGNLSTSEDNNLYIFLPFEIDSEQRQKLLNFYSAYRFTGFVSVNEGKDKEVLEVTIEPEGIPSIYEYIKLEKQDIVRERERLNIDIGEFDQWVEYHTTGITRRIPLNKNNYCSYYFIEEYVKKRQDFFSKLPEETKKSVIQRGQIYLEMLNRYYELSRWRFNHIMNTLTKLATVSKDNPIRLLTKSVELEAYEYGNTVNKHTLIGFEFPQGFLSDYRGLFKYGLPSGNLHHIYHFIQPEEVLKAIHMNKEHCLLYGGPILGEY